MDAHSPAGVWFSPPVRGTRPPPCSRFTLTNVDNHRAVIFGGYQPGRGNVVSDLYLIDLNTMVKCNMSITSYSLYTLEYAYTLFDFYRILLKWSHVRVSHGQWGELPIHPVVLDMLEITSTCW